MSAKPSPSKPRTVIAAAVPFRPYNSFLLTHKQMREALRGQGQGSVAASLVQLLEGEISVAVTKMRERVEGAPEAYAMLVEFYEGITALLDGQEAVSKCG